MTVVLNWVRTHKWFIAGVVILILLGVYFGSDIVITRHPV